MLIFLIVLGFFVLVALIVFIHVFASWKSAHDLYSEVTFTWKFKIHKRPWYCEYHSGIRMHDIFSIMIHNYPILTFRRWDDPHTDESVSYAFGFLFFFDISFLIKWEGEWLGKEYDENDWLPNRLKIDEDEDEEEEFYRNLQNSTEEIYYDDTW